MSKVGEVVRFGDKGISVEEARKKMLEAGQAPKGIQREVRKNEAVGVTAPVMQPTPVPAVVEPVATVEPATPPTPIVPPVVTEPTVDKIENSKFVASIFQEDGKWVAELVYKNGAGTERFEAPNKQALTLKLLEGKGNATLRVRESIRREKYGVELDQVYTLPDGITQEAYDAMPEDAQKLFIDTIATQNGIAFKDAHPEYYATPKNSEKIQNFLRRQPNENGGKGLPLTFRNLEFAFAELSETDDEWDFRPTAKEAAPTVPASAPLAVDSAPASAPATAPVSTEVAPAAPAVVVRKRGTTGLRPGDSSAVSTELDQTEEGQTPREPSEAELRKLPLSELQRMARKTYKPRQF